MREATIIYPHQLFQTSPAITADRPIYLVEEPLLLTHNPIHRQKLIFHKLSLDAYQNELETAGHSVTRLLINEHPQTTDIFDRLKKDGVTSVHVVDTTDNYLEQALSASGITRIWYESPLFILEKADAVTRFRASKRFLATFYKQLRKDKNILIESNGEPTGGQWSFDADNRKKLPKDIPLPSDITLETTTPDVVAAISWADNVDAEQYGDPGCWIPYTRAAAETFLETFLEDRFREFGPFEDAITTRSVRLFHSALSPLINVGLLSPQHVLEVALRYGAKHDIPINSLEGFVRQILGWREFIRASYESDGSQMRMQNFFNHTRPLTQHFWTGETQIEPVDHSITTALRYGYTHHIERLMVMGNFMLLSHIAPHDVYRWFMGMYVDAYDWVMVPNVYGMSQFADGGSFATKPYISGSNYIKKMSDYAKGDWEETWTALYWHFIETHYEFFKSNHRLSMMPRLLDKMDAQKRSAYLTRAQSYLNNP